MKVSASRQKRNCELPAAFIDAEVTDALTSVTSRSAPNGDPRRHWAGRVLRGGSMDSGAAQAVLMYFVLPVWLAAGFADYLCHRAAAIEVTSGWKESLLHLLQLAEMAVPTLAAIFLEINALVIATMIVCLIAHEATAFWDVSYAYRMRAVSPIEQHVHSFLEMLPLMGLLIVITLNWQQFLALFGLGQEAADFGLRLKQPPLPWLYVSVILSLVLLFEVLPYLEELARGWIHRGRAKPRPSGK